MFFDEKHKLPLLATHYTLELFGQAFIQCLRLKNK